MPFIVFLPWLASFLIGITGTLVGKVLFSLGMGLVSYAVLSTMTSNLIANAQSNYGLIDPAILQLLNLGGVGTSMGIIVSALTTRATLMAIKKLAPI